MNTVISSESGDLEEYPDDDAQLGDVGDHDSFLWRVWIAQGSPR